MMGALGLGAKMGPRGLALSARRYADLMAASREGHAMSDAEPPGGKKRKLVDERRLVDGSDSSGNTELVRDLELATLCEHHLLPFIGKCHVAYIPTGKVLGLSKVARIVDVFARRLQIQESLTAQIAETVMAVTNAEGVGVIVEAQHMCMMMRGVAKQNSSMKTSAMLGSFRSDQKTREEFLSLLRM